MPHRPQPRRFVTMQEAADMLRVEVRTIRRWISAGQLPAFRVGHGIRIRITDVEAMAQPIPAADIEHK